MKSAMQLKLVVPGLNADASPELERGSDLAPEGQATMDEESDSSQKQLGAYYTDETVARFLLRWAIVTGREAVLDPSFGGGVFLSAAAERIDRLGGNAGRQVFGVEVDDKAYDEFSSRLGAIGDNANLVHSSFFDVSVDDLPPVDAVVGNPPFIRYHRFKGEMRRKALQCAFDAGVRISQLASSWAPFLVHSAQFLKPEGRLAMVIPAELLHAAYARPVLAYLSRSFRVVRVLAFSRRLFPHLSEDTVLLLVSGKGNSSRGFALVALPDASSLARYEDPGMDLPPGTSIAEAARGEPRTRVAEYMIDDRGRELYRRLREMPQVRAFAEIADVGIGYVSGDNHFFHVTKGQASAYGFPSRFLKRAVRRGGDLRGLWFGESDWESLHDAGEANLLLYVPDGETLPGSIQAYLSEGTRAGVPLRYKCRVRRPWYRVPHVYHGDAFLTYMSGSVPRFTANEAGAVAPNTLLVVRFHALARRPNLDARGLALVWRTSLTALSSEIEGHSLGGGMLKLEPSEAERVLVTLPDFQSSSIRDLSSEVDELLRAGRPELAQERCDEIILRGELGFSAIDVRRLREGWLALRSRRLNR